MALTGKAKTEYQRGYMRRHRAAQKAEEVKVMPKEEARRMRKAGLDPEVVRASGSAYNALLLDRDAIACHLAWHHEARPSDADVIAQLEQLREHNTRLSHRITLLEAERVLADVGWTLDGPGRYPEESWHDSTDNTTNK